MLSHFQASYARVERSVQKLTDSVAAYNPSVRDAQELLAADEAVQRNMERLITHQRNHARLVSLRATTDALDETVKHTIRLLAATRHEILSIPALDRAERREVGVEEVLSFAKFIAPTTVPPTVRKPVADSSSTTTTTTSSSSSSSSSPSPSSASMPKKHFDAAHGGVEVGANGIATPAQQDDADPAAPRAGGAPEPAGDDFVPWPDVAKMQSGALGSIQRMLEEGRDPAAVLSAEEQAAAEVQRQEAEEEERKKAEEWERQQRDAFGDSTGRAQRRATVVVNMDDL